MNNLKRIWTYFRDYKFFIFLSMTASIVVALSDAAIAYIVKDVLDGIFISKDTHMLKVIPIALAVIFAARCIGSFVQSYFIQHSSQKAIEKIRNEMYEKIIRQPVSYFQENPTGVLITKMISDVSNLQSAVSAALRVFRSAFSVITLTAVVFYQSTELGMSIFVVAPMLFIIIRKSGSKMKKHSHKVQEHLGEVGTAMNESFTGIRVVKSFGTEDKEYAKFHIISHKELKHRIKRTLISSVSSPMIETLAGLAVALIIFYGGSKVINGEMTAGTFFSFLTAFGLMFEPIKKINNYNVVIQKALASADRIFTILDIDEDSLLKNGTEECDAAGKDISLTNISFSYPGHNEQVLQDVSMTITPGTTVALVGSSGAGKTTLMSLIPRFYDVTSGSIKIGGTDLRDFDMQSLRRNIGIVSQEPFLFNNTIMYNIAYGSHNADTDAVKQAAELAYADGFISELPDGYRTFIGERGCKLSGGQKQRITIARAILSNPPLLLLDEATSALDTESEKIVQKALSNLMKGRTSIVIAHRLSTILDADMIAVMDRGRIEASGTHAELLKSSSIYPVLYEMQFSGGAE